MLGAHLVPVRIEFLGDERRQAGKGTLPHFDMLDENGHEIVGADAHESIRDQCLRGGNGFASAERKVECDDETGRALEKRTAGNPYVMRGHDQPSIARAAVWMAARMRT